MKRLRISVGSLSFLTRFGSFYDYRVGRTTPFSSLWDEFLHGVYGVGVGVGV